MTETTANALIRLPHTGLRVPDTSLSVTAYRELTTSDGVAFTANLRVDSKIVGTIENEGHGGMTLLQPRDWRTYGEKQIEAYAARCRTEEGTAVTAEHLLDELIEEADWARKARGAAAKQRLLLRLMDHILENGSERADWPPYPRYRTDSPMPVSETQWNALRDELLDRTPPGPHGWWQGWHEGRWRDVTPRPQGVRTDLYG
ncbi:hypothetical protein [Plantactinospora sp. CA-290183]|uniref:hypothetical protein n=1 Tax=Plantactinospora sp. CA-290183 TaxID=3240006 RepID=UPI003D93860B